MRIVLPIVLGALAIPVARADPDTITCGGSYRDSCFDCGADIFDDEDNTCSRYTSSCTNPGSGDPDKVFRFRTDVRSWVQVDSDWGDDLKMGVYIQRGSVCNNTIACQSPRWNGTYDGAFVADPNVDYYLSFEEDDTNVPWDIWNVDWHFDLDRISCCPDNDGDGSYAYNAQCWLMPSSLRDCNDNDGTNGPTLSEVCDGRDNDCDNAIDEGLAFSTYYPDTDGDGYGTTIGMVSACARPDGYVAIAGDCDDTDADRRPGLTEWCDGKDNDCDGSTDEGLQTRFWRDYDQDGYGDPTTSTLACSLPVGYASNDRDCDDRDADRQPGLAEWCDGKDNDCDGFADEGVGAIWYRDLDQDGAGNPTVTVRSCTAPAGYVASGTDCDDSDAHRRPGLAEWCDGKDNDCNGSVDDGVGTLWYRDLDRDGVGNPNATVRSCTAPAGYVADGGDCDDRDADRRPGLTEWCDDKDNDCDGVVDEGAGPDWYRDADGDGYGVSTAVQRACTQPRGYADADGDCDDRDAERSPGLTEWCDDKDNDCDGIVDEEAVDAITWYRDQDRDGAGDPNVYVIRCRRGGGGWIANDRDCDDRDASVRPGAPEIPYDGVDQDCSGADLCDVDGDGEDAAIGLCGGDDCADGDAAIHPGAPERLDGVDNDCDGVVDDGTAASDDDGDGWTETAGDCDDADPFRNPGAIERCTGTDTDCDGFVDEETSCADDDGDGFSEDEGDCHDGDAAIHPGAAEIFGDGVDNDCDGLVDGGGFDPDGDGVSAEGGDCDDLDPSVRPGLPELADGKDNDCDGVIDEGTTAFDDDGDGFSEDEGDCDDTDPDVSPAGEEVANGVDDDCDGLTDDGGPSFDDDGDGLSEIQGDCDDGDATVRPGAAEVANGVDDDCDGTVDEGLVDVDGDGVTVEDGDCDDDDGWVHPGAAELCDGVDNDCDDRIDEGCGGVAVDTGRRGDTGFSPRGCTCASGGAGVSWAGGVLLLLLAARRRR